MQGSDTKLVYPSFLPLHLVCFTGYKLQFSNCQGGHQEALVALTLHLALQWLLVALLLCSRQNTLQSQKDHFGNRQSPTSYFDY